MVRHLFKRHWYLKFWLLPHQFGCCLKKWRIGGGTVIKKKISWHVKYLIFSWNKDLISVAKNFFFKCLTRRHCAEHGCNSILVDELVTYCRYFHSGVVIHMIHCAFCVPVQLAPEQLSETVSAGIQLFLHFFSL